MSEQVVSLLRGLRELLATPDKWCQHHYAEDADGRIVDVEEPNACRWCLVGGVKRLAPSNLDLQHVVRQSLMDASGLTGVLIYWNDSQYRKHADVLELIDIAIAKESADEQSIGSR